MPKIDLDILILCPFFSYSLTGTQKVLTKTNGPNSTTFFSTRIIEHANVQKTFVISISLGSIDLHQTAKVCWSRNQILEVKVVLPVTSISHNDATSKICSEKGTQVIHQQGRGQKGSVYLQFYTEPKGFGRGRVLMVPFLRGSVGYLQLVQFFGATDLQRKNVETAKMTQKKNTNNF